MSVDRLGLLMGLRGLGRHQHPTGNPNSSQELMAFTLHHPVTDLRRALLEGRALGTETVCDSGDFDIGHRVFAQNWNALRAVGESVNRVYVTPKRQMGSPLLTWPPFAG